MSEFKIIAQTTEATVVAEYTPEKRKSTDYQSELALEEDFIKRLISQGYERISITQIPRVIFINPKRHYFPKKLA